MIRNCISIGGDSDTIAAIAGGIAEAYFGVPEDFQKKVRRYVSPKLLSVSDAFDAWLEAKTGRDKIAAQIQNAEKKFCE